MYADPSGHFAICSFLISLAIGAFVSWGLSKIFGSQIAGGIGSVVGGGAAISTGISLCAFGPWGIVAGIILIAIGVGTAVFGVNEIVAGATGTNYIQNWTGMSDELYSGLYIGLNIASSVGSIAGNIGMKYASNKILNNIVNDPQQITNYDLWQIKTYGRYSSQWSVGTLSRGRNANRGYKLLDGKNSLISWSPGSGHHGNIAYWKVSSSLIGTNRFIYGLGLAMEYLWLI